MSELHEAVAALDGQADTPQAQAPANTMAEELAKVEANIKVAPPKIPNGKVVVAVELDRGDDSVRKGDRMVSVDSRDWLVAGRAVALRGRHVVAASCVYGRWSSGVPKVTACHYVVCPNCGRRVLAPLAVWEAKDVARRLGTEVDSGMLSGAILEKWGTCPCGGKWHKDRSGEKAELAAFAQKAIKAIEAMPEVGEFLPPVAFSVTAAGAGAALEPKWGWLSDAMASVKRGIRPYKRDDPATQGVILYNPGFWVGWLDRADDSNLFWKEGGKEKPSLRAQAFDPGEVDGL